MWVSTATTPKYIKIKNMNLLGSGFGIRRQQWINKNAKMKLRNLIASRELHVPYKYLYRVLITFINDKVRTKLENLIIILMLFASNF